jgi:2-C-methyl-D-erythritol 4-phosphate cytidylyltransferase
VSADRPRAALIVVAAGTGSRLGGTRHKALVSLGGEPLVAHCLRRLLALPWLDPAVLVGHPDDRPALLELIAGLERPVRLVDGGARRQDSVVAGLTALPDGPARGAGRGAGAGGAAMPDVVLVHDAARPFVPTDRLDRLVALASAGGAAILALPIADTVKEAAPLEDPRDPPRARATLPRQHLWAAQTPQAARRADLLALLQDAAREGRTVTDEAALFEAALLPVAFVEGSRFNFKVTSAEDLRLAEAVLTLEPDVRAERTS